LSLQTTKVIQKGPVHPLAAGSLGGSGEKGVPWNEVDDFSIKPDVELRRAAHVLANRNLFGKDLSMRVNGTVKFFNHSKGYGFIQPDDGSKDVFVHVSALQQSGVAALEEGDKVSFELQDDPRGRGKQATNIELSQS
jgi:CspA family cold shock protein